jgi:hypothetical protein
MEKGNHDKERVGKGQVASALMIWDRYQKNKSRRERTLWQ